MTAGAVSGTFKTELGIYSDFQRLPSVMTGSRGYGAPVLVRHEKFERGHITTRTGGSRFVLDVGSWRKRPFATAPTPHDLLDPGTMPLPLHTWAEETIKTSCAASVLSPTRFIAAGAWDVLDAAVRELSAARHPKLVPFIPIGVAALDQAESTKLLEILAPLRKRRLALLFAGTREELAAPRRLQSLRQILAAHNDVWLIGVDPLVATDALAHGASAAYVGVGSGLRWPAEPGLDNGGYFAKDAIPGTFNRDLLAMCSPSRYAEWYAPKPTPDCAVCGRPLHTFTSSEVDKAAIAVHNSHAAIGFARELLGQPAADRTTWLQQQRLEAFLRHASLNPVAATVDADRTLRALVHMDDPLGRSATPSGHLV